MWRRAERPDLEVVMTNGHRVRPVVTLVDDAFPGGDLRAHVVVVDHCYELVKVGRGDLCYSSSLIFREVHEVLRELPLLDGEPELHECLRAIRRGGSPG